MHTLKSLRPKVFQMENNFTIFLNSLKMLIVRNNQYIITISTKFVQYLNKNKYSSAKLSQWVFL